MFIRFMMSKNIAIGFSKDTKTVSDLLSTFAEWKSLVRGLVGSTQMLD